MLLVYEIFFISNSKGYLSYEEITQKRNQLFDNEMKRQTESIGRIEKIEVRYLGLPENETLIMNKNISTPYNCAQRKLNSNVIDFFFVYQIYL